MSQFNDSETNVKRDNLIEFSVCKGPIENTATTNRKTTFEHFAELNLKFKVGTKEGSYVCPCTMRNNVRNGMNAGKYSMLVLDCDSTIDLETGEITDPDGAPDPETIREAFKDLTHHLATTHSHRNGKGNRYRIWVPAPFALNQNQREALTDHLFSRLHQACIAAYATGESFARAQGYYVSRVASEDSPRFGYYHEAGPLDVDVDAVTAAYNAKKGLKVESAPNDTFAPKPARDGLIGWYNSHRGDLENVEFILQEHGYEHVRRAWVNGFASSRHLAPGSNSGKGSVRSFVTHDGTLRTYSGHDPEHDPIAKDGHVPASDRRKAHDAFDLFRILEHGGDMSKALRAVSAMEREYPFDEDGNEKAVDPLEAPNNLDGFLERFIWIIDGEQVFDTALPVSEAVYTKNEFMSWSANRVIISKGPRGGETATPIAAAWRTSDKRKSARRLAYRPGQERLFSERGLRFVNSFHFPDHPETNELPPQEWIDHIRYLFGDETERFLDWMAHMIQRPEERPQVVPLHIASSHGSGRGWITQMINALIGLWNQHGYKLERLADGDFDPALDDKLFSSIPEVRIAGKNRYTIDDKLRDLLTESVLSVNKKYLDQVSKLVYTRFLLASNHHDCLSIPFEDRRIWVIHFSGKLRSPDAFKHLYTSLKDETNVAAMFWFLKRRAIQFDLMGRAPMNEAKQRLVALTSSESDNDIAGLAEDGIQVATMEQLRHLLDIQRLDKARQDQLAASLNQHGRKYTRPGSEPGKKPQDKIRWNESTVRVYIIDNDVSTWAMADPEAVKVALDATAKIIGNQPSTSTDDNNVVGMFDNLDEKKKKKAKA